ncbi:FAD-linked oxidase [Litchfieldella qijiaojingensis]|uniref:FAD-linked oxidase n=1 Tax=Litchfieldella qijiaojingensis TaxID=980347 RepID=A0ABQ2Z2T2_9GAMM|nr:FAD-binding oxidoreductase [Halomonas qijiaojingensis]GGY01062.1 FAD-linked oxidase [Halomonas qijiaojingensis]
MIVNSSNIRQLGDRLQGQLFQPEAEGYDDARKVFNAMIDRRPALIVRCADVTDVIAAVHFARETELPIAVRGGGHSVVGSAVCDEGLVIDLSGMKDVSVDPDKRTARAEGGTTWGDFDRATQRYGLATTGGIVPSTGIGGLTLGGGIGRLNRKYGLACDNLLSADVVTADGTLVTASADENEDLFWGLRGGGGNFGIVTSFEYQLHPVGPVLGGEIIFPLDQARTALRFYRDWSTDAPDELRADATLASTPDGPGLAIEVCYCGAIDAGEKVLLPLRKLGSPMLDTIDCVPYETVQNLLTDIFPPGMHHYWKSSFVREFSDDAIDTIVDFFTAAVPPPLAVITFEHLGGVIGRIGEQDTAFSHRQAQHSLLVLRTWQDPEKSEANIAWGRQCYGIAEPFLESGVYVNYLGDEGEARVRAAYGANYERLVALKNKYDPANVFRFHQNIKPA